MNGWTFWKRLTSRLTSRIASRLVAGSLALSISSAALAQMPQTLPPPVPAFPAGLQDKDAPPRAETPPSERPKFEDPAPSPVHGTEPVPSRALLPNGL